MTVKMVSFFLALGIAISALGEMPWNREELYAVPEVFPANDLNFRFQVPPTLRPVFFAGPLYHGKPTRIFAWIGIPAQVRKPVPGMVLIHGGGGTAFSEWVEYWNRRGYAAIAVDTVGCVPLAPFEGGECRARHENFPGPGDDIFNTSEALTDRWPYHAVASVILAHSLLRSQPGVDADRIGVTGISWGGFLTAVAAGIDNRFAMAAPVYGCGFLDESWVGRDVFPGMAPEAVREWMTLWDPSQYLPQAKMPMLFVNDPNDFAFFQSAWQKSAALPEKSHLSLRLNLTHSHWAGMTNEVKLFADHVLCGRCPWPEPVECGWRNGKAFAVWDDLKDAVKIELVYSTDPATDNTRKWQTGAVERYGNRIEAVLPEKTLVWFFNLTTRDGAVISTPSRTVE